MATEVTKRHQLESFDDVADNHQVLWYRTDQGRARAVADFLLPGLKNGDLLAIVLPLRELNSTEKRLIKEKFPIHRLMREGRLMLFASEELLPGRDGGYEKTGKAIATLHMKAKAEGRNLTLVGRVAPILFEQGDISGAVAVEIAADSSLGQARLLCLYDARKRQELPKSHGKKIDDLHTSVYDETPSGGIRIRMKRGKEEERRLKKRKST